MIKRYFWLSVSTYLTLTFYIAPILRMLARKCIVWECHWEGWLWEVTLKIYVEGLPMIVQSNVLLWESTLRVYFEGFLWKCFVCDFCFVRVRLYGLLWKFTLRVYLDNPSWVSMIRNSFSNVRHREFPLRVCFDNMSKDSFFLFRFSSKRLSCTKKV